LAALLSILKLFSCLQNELKDFYFGVSQGLKVKVLNIEKKGLWHFTWSAFF